MNINKMSRKGAVKTINEICDGMKTFIENNPESAKELLKNLVGNIIEPLSMNDFFGTEGWEHGLNVDI